MIYLPCSCCFRFSGDFFKLNEFLNLATPLDLLLQVTMNILRLMILQYFVNLLMLYPGTFFVRYLDTLIHRVGFCLILFSCVQVSAAT